MAFVLPKRISALALLIMLIVPATQVFAQASPLNIVAVGASNTSGWGVGAASAYPARLEALLRERGIDARVANAGIPFHTTTNMRARIDSAVPDGTDLVILQPGGNDKRFLWSLPFRAANIDAMVKRLAERQIKVIVFDPDVEWKYYQWDFIHFTNEGHAWIAATLLPEVISAVGPLRTPAAPPKRPAAAQSKAPAGGKTR
jgi:acyl-CoA thioesterase I